MIIRPSNKTDFEGIMHIEQTAFPEWLQWDRSSLAAELNQHYNYVVTDNDVIVGFAMLDTQYKEGPYISNVAVLPSHQGQGVGKLLLETLENFCRSNGEQYLYLHVHETNIAQDFYLKHGYTVVRYEKNFYQYAPDGIKGGLFMRKSL